MTATSADTDADGHGRQAQAPNEIPFKGWLDILARVLRQMGKDRAGLTAGAVTFFMILALVPAIAIFVSIYGLSTSTANINDQIDLLQGFFPGSGLDLLRTELERITSASPDSLSISIIVSFLFSLWGATNGVRALFQAMNVAYNEEEKRNFFVVIGLSLAFTLGGMVLIVVMLNVVIVLPVIMNFLGLNTLWGILSVILSPLLFLVASNIAIAALYRWGPSRRKAKWRWITWGSALASIIWMIAAAAFAFYLANWSNYNATYGSLGTIVGLMMWFYISAFIVIFGAELNAEIEHQTELDSTIGRDRPIGQRGAHVADTVGKTRQELG